ncbi:MAG: hypothetical protein ACI35S_00635 [Anaeroplasma sp.]
MDKRKINLYYARCIESLFTEVLVGYDRKYESRVRELIDRFRYYNPDGKFDGKTIEEFSGIEIIYQTDWYMIYRFWIPNDRKTRAVLNGELCALACDNIVDYYHFEMNKSKYK